MAAPEPGHPPNPDFPSRLKLPHAVRGVNGGFSYPADNPLAKAMGVSCNIRPSHCARMTTPAFYSAWRVDDGCK